MGRRKKSAAMFRKELQDLLESLGKNSEQRIRDDYRQYNNVLRQKNRGKKQQRDILTIEQQRILNDDALHKNYLCGKQLTHLEQKLQKAEKREDTEATNARSVIAAATVLTSTDTTIVDNSIAVDSPSVDRSIIPLVSSETEKNPTSSIIANSATSNNVTVPVTTTANSTPITDIFEKMTLQKDIDSNSAAEAQDLSARSSIEAEGIYPRSENKILTVEHFTCIATQPAKGMAEKWLKKLSPDNLVTFEKLQHEPAKDYSGTFAVCVLVNIIRTRYDDANKMHCQRIYKVGCLHSAAEMNTVAILEGSGYGKHLFSTDIKSRDNGTIREQHVYLCFNQTLDSV